MCARLVCHTDRARLSYLCQVSCCNCRRSTGVRGEHGQLIPAAILSGGVGRPARPTCTRIPRCTGAKTAADVTEKFRTVRETVRRSAPSNPTTKKSARYYKFYRIIDPWQNGTRPGRYRLTNELLPRPDLMRCEHEKLRANGTVCIGLYVSQDGS